MKHEYELVPFYSSILDDFFGTKFENPERKKLPAMNIHEDEKTLKIDLRVPGMKKENIHVSYENGYLTISGSNDKECKEKECTDKECKGDKKYLRKEFCCCSFERTISIPQEHYMVNDAKAEYKDGILHLCIPKVEEKKSEPTKIEIM
ncbi:MAG: Hsp20/alpha crystallin family protein [Bacteroidales bacterium]|nr:Hsp20/alpha crystallin family protein [Bacteroidales bacterium]